MTTHWVKMSSCSNFVPDAKLMIIVLNYILKSIHLLKSVMMKCRKMQFSYVYGEITNVDTKILVSKTKIFEFSLEKFLVF